MTGGAGAAVGSTLTRLRPGGRPFVEAEAVARERTGPRQGAVGGEERVLPSAEAPA